LRIVLAGEGAPALDDAVREIVANAARDTGAVADVQDAAAFAGAESADSGDAGAAGATSGPPGYWRTAGPAAASRYGPSFARSSRQTGALLACRASMACSVAASRRRSSRSWGQSTPPITSVGPNR
jgi:hypothetical protein